MVGIEKRRLGGRRVDPTGKLEFTLTRLLVSARLGVTLLGADVHKQVAVGEMRSIVNVDQALGIEVARQKPVPSASRLQVVLPPCAHGAYWVRLLSLVTRKIGPERLRKDYRRAAKHR